MARVTTDSRRAADELTDEELVERYRRHGDRQAAELLLSRHLGAVRSMVGQLVLEEAAADDLCQEVFLRALRGLDGFTGRATFSTWLYRIALNTVYSYLRQRQRSGLQFCAQVPERPQRGGAPEQAALQRELEDEVTAALAALTPKLRAAIVLTCLHEHTIAEAAAIEGCTKATMYWRVFQARRLLERRLQKYLEE